MLVFSRLSACQYTTDMIVIMTAGVYQATAWHELSIFFGVSWFVRSCWDGPTAIITWKLVNSKSFWSLSKCRGIHVLGPKFPFIFWYWCTKRIHHFNTGVHAGVSWPSISQVLLTMCHWSDWTWDCKTVCAFNVKHSSSWWSCKDCWLTPVLLCIIVVVMFMGEVMLLSADCQCSSSVSYSTHCI
jgi:hypothetical protein